MIKSSKIKEILYLLRYKDRLIKSINFCKIYSLFNSKIFNSKTFTLWSTISQHVSRDYVKCSFFKYFTKHFYHQNISFLSHQNRLLELQPHSIGLKAFVHFLQNLEIMNWFTTLGISKISRHTLLNGPRIRASRSVLICLFLTLSAEVTRFHSSFSALSEQAMIVW